MIGDSRPHELEDFKSIITEFDFVEQLNWEDELDKMINKKVKKS